MTMAIGQQPFINLSRPPAGLMEQLRIESRSGVAGYALWKDGRRGEPFELTSVVNATSITSAQALLRSYEQMVGGDPVTITFAGRVLSGVLFQVLDVQPVEGGVRATLYGLGGVGGGASFAILRCRWRLLPLAP